jgi:anthranilate phosphoribosyltransferase
MKATMPILAGSAAVNQPLIDMKPLLSRLWPLPPAVTPDEIAEAISYFFTNQVSDVQAGSLLICLHFTGLDRQAEVLAKCAAKMRQCAARIDSTQLNSVIKSKGKGEGAYLGGLVSLTIQPRGNSHRG